MSTMENPELSVLSSNARAGLSSITVFVCADYRGVCGFSRHRKAEEVPAELWAAGDDVFFAHPWSAFLVQEAKENLASRLEEIMGPKEIERSPKLQPKPFGEDE
ncbi:MAG: hypothetical protein WC565_10715 [Parcubacteria group bacterium]